MGHGNYIVLQHTIGGTTYTSVYAQLKQNSILCSVGDQVSAGQQIALSGDSGNATGPHLHFEIYEGEFRGSIKALRGQSFQYYLNNAAVLSGMTFSSHMNTSSVNYGSWIEANCTLANGVWQYNASNPSSETLTLNIDGNLNGGHYYNIAGIGQFDVYINGILDAQNVNEYNKKWPAGTSYEVRNIRADAGYLYGSSDYPLEGTLSKDSLIILYFFTKYDVVFDANGGIGAPANQVKIKGNDLTLASDTPHRTGYSFIGWATSSNAQAAEYQPNGIYSANQNVVLYAVWKSNVAINQQNFPDSTFRTYVSESFDMDKDDYLSEVEIAVITEVNVSGQSVQEPGPISSLKGIEYFSNLKTLYCANNQLTELDISANTQLEGLACGFSFGDVYLGNQLKNLDVSHNPALVTLYCDNNQLTSLNISNNTNLNVLMCSNNQLTSLDVSNNSELVWLYCWGNQLSQLDVSNNTKLMQFSCAQNQINQLDVSQNTGLVIFYCNNNQIKELNVWNCANLQELSASNNQLIELDVSNCTKLQKLLCAWNNISELDISRCMDLQSFECGANPLESLDISNNPALWHLGCFENQLTELDLSNNAALQEMWCYSNQLENLDLSNCTSLVFLSCWNNALEELNLSNNTALQRLFCYQNQLPNLDITACSDLVQLTQSSAPVIENSVVRFASETDPVWIVYDLDTPLTPKSASGYTIEYNLNG
mgnify:CR=1 FL=1